jgi:hypothetical protein
MGNNGNSMSQNGKWPFPYEKKIYLTGKLLLDMFIAILW